MVICRQQDAVRLASATGRWTPGLEGHAAVCPTCSEIRLVTRALAAPVDPVPLTVDPAVLWARASHAAQLVQAARLSRLLTGAQVAIAAVAAVVVASSLLWSTATPEAGGPEIGRLLITGGVLIGAAAVGFWRFARP